MEGREAVEYVLAQAREQHLSDVDVLLNREEHLTVHVLDGRVEKVDQSIGLGLGVRVVSEGRTGLAFTERLEPQAMDKAVLSAKENALLQDPTEVVLNTEIPAVPPPEAVPQKAALKEIRQKPAPRLIPRVSPKAKPNPPSQLDAGRLAALIDKSKKEQAAAKVEARDETEKLEEVVRRASLDARRARIATATLVAAIRRKVEECWSIPAGAKEAADLNVRLKIYLTLDGNLARPIELLDLDRMHEPGQEYFRTAVESAARAVRRCAPYELPKDQYDLWRVIEFNFYPREMIGG